MLYYKYSKGRPYEYRGKTRKEEIMETMTRLELLTLLLSIQALLESGNEEAAKKLIAEVISEAKNNNSDK